MKNSNHMIARAVSKGAVAFVAIIASFFTSLEVLAQSVPEKVDVDINTGSDSVWYGQPWVWAVGIAVFVIIVIAMTRNNREA